MARDATARLYGVDEDTLVFTKMRLTKKYDHGTIEFRAKPGNLIDLLKLHESIWATRLSGGTRSGVIWLQVTANGEVSNEDGSWVLKVAGSDRHFVLTDDVRAKPDDAPASGLGDLREAASSASQFTVTGYVEGWIGRWPNVLRKPPSDQPRLMVTEFKPLGESE